MRALEGVEGVRRASFDFATKTAMVIVEQGREPREEAIFEALRRAGYREARVVRP